MIHCDVCGFTWEDEVLTTYYVCCVCIMLNSMVMVKLELLFGRGEGVWGRNRSSFMNGVFQLHVCPTFKQLKTDFFITYLLFCLCQEVTVFGFNFNSCRVLVYMFMNLVIFSCERPMPPENSF
jgi:hypothetical protein